MKGQEGRIVDIAILLNEGWKKETYFGNNGLVLSKGDDRILYSIKQKRVIIHYKSKPILGC